MNRFVKLMATVCLLSGVVAAQRGGTGGGRGGMASPGRGWIQPERPGPPSGFGAVTLSHEDGRGSHAGWNQPFLGASYPAFFSPYDAEPWPAQSNPNVMILMMQPAPEPPPEPPPVRSQMREYSWPAAENDGPPAFAIVLKDGTVTRAALACRQGSILSYVTPDGTGYEVNISIVDRDATRRVNSRDILQ